MLLIVSDIHFGKGAAEAERAKESELLALLESVRGRVDAFYLLGDVFDQYVEYRYLIPKGFARFQGSLAQMADEGVRVHYVVGNHDPWHLDYFGQELGVEVHRAAVAVEAFDRSIVLEHGDAADSRALSRTVRRIVRHPLSAFLFRTMLPADAAYRLTRWTKENFGSDPVDPETVRRLSDHAKSLIEEGAEVVVLGHSHVPACTDFGGAVYVNAGSWHIDRTYVVIDASSIALRRWNGEDVSVYALGAVQSGRSQE